MPKTHVLFETTRLQHPRDMAIVIPAEGRPLIKSLETGKMKALKR